MVPRPSGLLPQAIEKVLTDGETRVRLARAGREKIARTFRRWGARGNSLHRIQTATGEAGDDAIVHYGMGNPGSIRTCFSSPGGEHNHIGSRDHLAIRKLILPAWRVRHAMERIRTMGLLDVLNEQAIVRKSRYWGYCLGMQILCGRSEEGSLTGLGLAGCGGVRFRFEGPGALRCRTWVGTR